MATPNSRFTGNFDSLRQSRLARGLEEEPVPIPERLTFREHRYIPPTPTLTANFWDSLTMRDWTFGTEVSSAEIRATREASSAILAGSSDGMTWATRTAVKPKPSIKDVETRLGVSKEMWDTLDPEDLIEAIYELSIG